MRLDIEEYEFSVEYIKGKDNVIADALSRISINQFISIQETAQILRVQTRSTTNKLNFLGGHVEQNKLYTKICSNHYWKKMLKDIAKLENILKKNVEKSKQSIKTLSRLSLRKPHKHLSI